MIEFSPIKLMASIFTPEFSFSDKLALLNLFQDLSGGKFDGELFSSPIPQDAPAEIPRFILSSLDRTWKLEVSLERTNLIYLNPDFSPITDPNALDFANYVKEFFRSYKKAYKIRIQRLAFIIERVAKIEKKTPAQFIADTFCKEKYLKKPFNKTNSFEIHSLKKYEFKKFEINSWVRLKSVVLASDPPTPALQVVSDINTFAIQEAQDKSFELKDIDRFFKFIPDELENILTLYFR